MRIYFRNNYPERVWIAILKYDPDECGGDLGNWRKQGWWEIDHGDEVRVFSTTNRYAAFHAIADDGAYWSGSYGPVSITWDCFDLCLNIGGTFIDDEVGMRLINLGRWHWMRTARHTVTLTE